MNSLNYENITKFFKYLEENKIEGIEEIKLQPCGDYIYINFDKSFDAEHFYFMHFDKLPLEYDTSRALYLVKCEYRLIGEYDE